MKNLIILFIMVFFLQISFAQKTPTTITGWQQKLQTAKHDTTKMVCYLEIANLQIRADSIFYYVRKGLNISKGYPNHIINAKLYNGLAMAYDRLGKSDSAAYYYDQAYQIGLRLKDDKQIKYALFNKTLLCKSSGQRINELQQILKKYNFLQSRAYDRLLLFSIYTNIAQDYITLENLNKGKEYLQKSRKFMISFRDSVYYNVQYSVLLSSEADLFYKSNTPSITQTFSERYKPFLNEAEKIASIKKNELSLSMMSVVYGNYATILTLEKKYNKSNYYINKATVDIKVLPEIILYNKYYSLGKNYVGLGQIKKGLMYLEKSYNFFKNSQFDDKEFNILENMAMAYSKLGKVKKANEYLVKALSINKKYNNNQQQQLSLEVEKQLELSEKQKEIAFQEFQNKLKDERIKIEQQQKYMFIGLSALTIFLLAWALSSYRKQRHLRRLLEIQNYSLEKKTKELTDANHVKDKIFAVLGHDLQNPINELKAILMLFNSNAITPSKLKEFMIPLANKIESVEGMLNNLLYWSLLELSYQNNKRHLVDLNYIIERVLQQLKNNVEAKSINILLELKPTEAVVNEKEIEIVLRNLLSNAIKFTPINGTILIESVNTNNQASINIKDSGIGLPESFNYNTRFPETQKGTSGEKGVGLGLKICKELVLKNAGELTLNSTLGGTTVSLLFK